jgi:hypothetical protein
MTRRAQWVGPRWGLLVVICTTGTQAQGLTKPASPGASAPVAQRVQGGPAWHTLSAKQREFLAPIEGDWAGMEAGRKAKWLEVVARFPAMPPDEQQRIQQRMRDWARLTPSERANARLTFQESKQIPREEKQARWEAYQALPEDERRALAQRAKHAADRPSSAPGSQPSVMSAKNVPNPAVSASSPLLRPVSPTVVQAKPGATTTLMTRPVVPPSHQQPGQPKIAAKASEVDRATLLPRSGPQAAAPASASHP